MTEHLTSKHATFIDKEDVLNFLGELMADYVDREQLGKADLVGDAIKMITADEPVAPSSPPADPDPEPSRADKLRAALEPTGVKVTVLGEADEPGTHHYKLDMLVSKILETHDRAGVAAVVSPILRELDRAIQVVKDYDKFLKKERAAVPQADDLRRILKNAWEHGEFECAECVADMSKLFGLPPTNEPSLAGGQGADETTAATEPVSRPASPPSHEPKPPHEREPPHCSSCSCGMPAPPSNCAHPFAKLGIDGDGVMWCTECLEKPLVIEQPWRDDSTKSALPADEKTNYFAMWRDRTAAEVANELPAGETSAVCSACNRPAQVFGCGSTACPYGIR